MTMRNGHRSAADNRVPDRLVSQVTPTGVSFAGRIRARVFAGRYDQQVEDGARVIAGTPLAAHHARLASRREREDMAHALTNVMIDAGLGSTGAPVTRRVPIAVDAVRQSSDLLSDALSRLLGPLPVQVRGMARLRILLSDGRGPVYREGPGTLSAALRGVLAAM